MTDMIRRLGEKDRQHVLKVLVKEPSINLFIIGDIENFGFDKDFQQLWGHFHGDQLVGVLLRFRESFIPYYTVDDPDIKPFLEIIKSHQGDMILSGKESILSLFKEELKDFSPRSLFFCELKDGSGLALNKEQQRVKVAAVSDAQRVVDMVDQITEFSGVGSSVDMMKHKIETKTGRVYYIEDEHEQILSLAQTTAENSMSAMIVGVATEKEARGQGLASLCMTKLCQDVIDEGKTLCLFYDNPKAGSIYHRLGFKTIENWMMMVKKKTIKED